MKLKTIITILFIVVLSAATANKAGAAPWRHHHRHYWRAWYGPHVNVSVYPAPVVRERYYGGYYPEHYYRPHRYWRSRSYDGYRRWR